MGFSTLIDILGSTIVGGMLLLILFRMNDAAVQNNYVYGSDLTVQESLVEAVRVIEYDFRKIGYCQDFTRIGFNQRIILQADSTMIQFLTDVARFPGDIGDGNLDTIEYRLGPTNELSGTTNPRDRILYRVVNSDSAIGSNVGITEFRLKYFDDSGTEILSPVADTRTIRTMQIDLVVENIDAVTNVFAVDSLEDDRRIYSQAVWRQIRLASKNLRNR